MKRLKLKGFKKIKLKDSLDQSLKVVLIVLLRFYQIFLSPLKSPCCRYYPSCSTYSLTLFKYSQPLEALFFSIIRVLRCNPWAKGGYDYPLIQVTLNELSYQPIPIAYWIVPVKPLHICMTKPLKFRGYLLLKD